MPPSFRRRRTWAGLDPQDDKAVRSWILQEIDEEVALHGRPIPAIWAVLDDGHVDRLPLDPLTQQDPDCDQGATFAAAWSWPGVRRVFLSSGVRTMEGPTLALFAEEVRKDGVPIECFSGTRPFRTDARGLGNWEGPWDFDRVWWPPPIAAWMVGEGGRPATVLPPLDKPDIWTAMGSLPEDQPLPDRADKIAERLQHMVLPRLLRDGLGPISVIRVRGRELIWLELHSELPTDLDDFVRAVAAWDRKPDGIAVVRPARIELPDGPRKGVMILAEKDGLRAARSIALDFENGVPTRWTVSASEPWGPTEQWLGVKPRYEYRVVMDTVGDA